MLITDTLSIAHLLRSKSGRKGCIRRQQVSAVWRRHRQSPADRHLRGRRRAARIMFAKDFRLSLTAGARQFFSCIKFCMSYFWSFIRCWQVTTCPNSCAQPALTNWTCSANSRKMQRRRKTFLWQRSFPHTITIRSVTLQFWWVLWCDFLKHNFDNFTGQRDVFFC